MSNIKFQISPELNDGDNDGMLKTPQQVADFVQAWADNFAEWGADVGEGFQVKIIEMSDEEYDAILEE